MLFFVATTTPAQASTIGDLQNQLISLLNQLISLLTNNSPVVPAPVVVPPVATTTTATSTKPYTVSDVVTVVTINVDPIPNAIDDEYTEYTVTLKDGSRRVVAVHGFAPFEMNQNNFYASGFSGDVTLLMKMAVAAPVPAGAPVIKTVTQNNREITVFAEVTLDMHAGIPAVMGPVLYGTIDWGDKSTASSLFSLASGATQTISEKHTYATLGTYTITVTDRQGLTVKKVVVVN